METTTAKKWSLQQLAIFAWFAAGIGCLLVRARAGTGKTTTIIEAVKHAGHEAKILLAAFNRRIYLELKARVEAMGELAKNVEVRTLHALGFRFILRQWPGAKIDETGQVDTDRVVAVVGKQAAETVMGLVPMVRKLAGLLKNIHPFTYDINDVMDLAFKFDCEPSEEQVRDGWTIERVCRAAGKARDAAMVRDPEGRISFDDMIYIPLANNFTRPWFSMVVVDEAQDMNYSQLLLAQKACKPRGRIVVVGDDFQAIYGFRGADEGSLDRLKHELRATELGLTTTYRCGKAIVDVARAIVPDFDAGENNPAGIVDGCSADALYDLAVPGDFILSRKNARLMPLCLGFLKRGIRCRIEGKDVGKQLRETVQSFKARTVPEFISRVQGWGKKRAQRVSKKLANNEEQLSAKLDELADQVEMLTALAEGCASIAEVLARTETLFGDSADGDTLPTIVCSSVHKAKGLEATRVFILADTINTRNREEANIYYVAVTRAKAQLTMAMPVAA